MPCCTWNLFSFTLFSKPTEDAKEVCLGNYDAGEYRSKSALKMPKSERLKRIDIQEAANNIIEATNKKRKKDSDMLRDFKKTAEYQVVILTHILKTQFHSISTIILKI